MFVFCVFILSIFATIIDRYIGFDYETLRYGYANYGLMIATFFASLAVTIRRLHDIGKSGLNIFLS